MKLSTLLIAIPLFVAGCKDDPPVVPPIIPPDSTSQEFTIQVYEVGAPHTFQITNDVWVFDKNNIWVVGDFYLSDSTVSGGTRESNIIRWNGTKWYPYGPFFNSSGLIGISAIDKSKLFLTDGLVIKYDGVFNRYNFASMEFGPGQSIRKVWALDETNIWGVGLNGMVVHYDGTSWKKLIFPEGWNFGEITGSTKTGRAYANVSDFGNPGGMYVAELRPDTVLLINKAAQNDGIVDVALLNDSTVLSVGFPLRKVNVRTGKDTLIASFGWDIPEKIAYHSEIDYFIYSINSISRKNGLRHYNGHRFKEISIPDSISDVFFSGSHAANDTFAFVGDTDNGKSIIMILTRK